MNSNEIKTILDNTNINAINELDIIEYVNDLEDTIKNIKDKLELMKSTIDDEPNIARINLIEEDIKRVLWKKQ